MRGRGGGKKEGSKWSDSKISFQLLSHFHFFVVLRFLAIFNYRNRFALSYRKQMILEKCKSSLSGRERESSRSFCFFPSPTWLASLSLDTTTKYGSYSSSAISSPDRTRYVPLSSLFISHLSPSSLPLVLRWLSEYHDLMDEQTVSEQILPHLESIKSQNEIKNYLQVRSTLSLSLPLLAIQS